MRIVYVQWVVLLGVRVLILVVRTPAMSSSSLCEMALGPHLILVGAQTIAQTPTQADLTLVQT